VDRDGFGNDCGLVLFQVGIVFVLAEEYLTWAFVYNASQKIAPVPGSTQWLEVDAKNETSEGLLIGYKLHPVGLVCYVLTLVTLAGWISVMTWLVIQVSGTTAQFLKSKPDTFYLFF
jgi:hypothetical protein